MVIDDCWQEHHRLDEYNGGPWTKGNAKFPDMKGLADKLKEKGVRPGIWVRLLLNEDENIPDEWRISYNDCLDPSHPDALAYIRRDIERICDWGYTLIKHDFSTFDLFGKWGFEANLRDNSMEKWHFYVISPIWERKNDMLKSHLKSKNVWILSWIPLKERVIRATF